MAWCWGCTVLLEAEECFHRIKGYRDVPVLIERLQKVIDHKEAVA